MKLPENKFDIESLLNMNSDFILENQKELLVWMQDTNWPIWDDMLKKLQPYFEDMESSIIEILRMKNDDAWRYNLMIGLIYDSNNISEKIIEELKRIYYNAEELVDIREGCKIVFDKKEIFYLEVDLVDPLWLQRSSGQNS